MRKIPYGYCKCGCGKKTKIITVNLKSKNLKKGKHYNYIRGHNKIINLEDKIKYEIDGITGCWNWTGNIDKRGYGLISIAKKTVKAHRFVYKILRRLKEEKGKELDHICANKKCVNPNHLRYVYHFENVQAGKLAKLNIGSVREIRLKSKEGIKAKDLAELYKVSTRNINKILSKETWNME